ncbi:3-keto-5-aminohexanoate cleavage protein [Nakamurella deserti]|uniref:3-keto-5-aminohexanoate cleavage protein n=1 Tax=Nakamurella deserti TaxID=2164074 RepID=UPI000DBE3B5B|nr:3-keto-5-aminohexanoate cleavage protein [Nakamurella deserti]
MSGVLLSLALPAADDDVLLRLVADAVHVGAVRVHLAAPASVVTVRALRAATPALLSAATGPADDVLDLVGHDHPAVAGHTVFVGRAGDAVLVDMVPPAADDDAALVAALSGRLAGLPADGPLRSVIARGDRATPAVLTALATGAHLRIGPGDGPVVVGDAVRALARAAALARLAGRPPSTVDEARARLLR